MDNDLNIPKALGRLFRLRPPVNRLLDRGELDGDQVGQVLDFMRQVNGVLDVIDFRAEQPDAQVAGLIEARERARRSKDFQTADTIRKELESLGVRVADRPVGTGP